MNYTKSQLQETIISLHRNTPKEFKGYTSKEIALMVGKETQDIHQVLKRLVGKGILYRRKEKRGVEKSTFVYYFNEYGLITESSCFTTCNKCQWFSGLEHCILLNKAKEDSPWSLTSEQKKRTEAVSLHSIPACDKFEPRVNGKWKSKTLKDFVKRNTNKTTLDFHCPVKRCGKVIDELSDPMQLRNIGANTLYCPHCGSPINFAYDNGLARYQVQYWDSKFDILQNSYRDITGLELIDRFQTDRPNGVSIIKHRSYYLDLKNEILYVGSEMTPEEFKDSKDLAYFSLRYLNYIALKHKEDYEYFTEMLHEIDPETNRPLYPRIQLFFTPGFIESVEPTLKEIGGNEILIATGALNLPMFFANIQNRKAVLEKKLDGMVDIEFVADIKSALECFERDTKKYAKLNHLTFNQWQQFEGGFASVMLEPFAKEILKYQFDRLSREKTRMVRGEPFMTFGFFIARSPQSSFENGVNKTTELIIKETIYNEIEQAWNDLRGWCHRKYPFGLLLDYEEPPKAVSKLWIHEAIRNKEITKFDFDIKRGKRFEKYYSIAQNSHALEVVKKVSRKTLHTKIVTGSGKSTTLIREIRAQVEQLKRLLNSIADSTVELLTETKQYGKITTVWKKLQETRCHHTLTETEFNLLQNHTQRFFKEEFSFEPLVISEIL